MGIRLGQMPEAKLPAFDWDDANTAHIARHGVSPAEAEQIVLGASLPLETEERSGEDRHTELGESAEGRLLLVVWIRRRRRIRVVTAFPANRKWRALWKRIKGEHHAE
jgi:uncharacterized DUF497 family protein